MLLILSSIALLTMLATLILELINDSKLAARLFEISRKIDHRAADLRGDLEDRFGELSKQLACRAEEILVAVPKRRTKKEKGVKR